MSNIKFLCKSPDMNDFDEIVFPVTEIRQVQPYNYKGKNYTMIKTIYQATYVVKLPADIVIERLDKKRK